MRNLHLPPLLLAFCFFPFAETIFGQIAVEGYVFEANNRGYLQQAKVTILEVPDNILRFQTLTDSLGHFSTALPPGNYRLVTTKDIFFDSEQTFKVEKEKVFLKTELNRKPGYLFDITVAEARESPDLVVDAVQGAWIEIYNRTQKRPELVLQNYPNAFFQHTFEQGNHYTILVRKPGFIAKRIEVYVNVKGCILCVDGASTLTPGVTENLTANNTMGTLITNIELDRAKLDKRIPLRNIYYDFDKWDIRPEAAKELDKVVTLLKDNPGLKVELGSHTDSRGSDEYNMTLSDKRAAAAVAYIESQGIDTARISFKGYGESQLVNRCKNGVTCSEEAHQENRRTELRITGVSQDSLEYLTWKSLEQIVQEEELEKAQKAQKTRGRPLQEANTSVPLPELKPEAHSEILQERGGGSKYLPQAIASNFTGYAVEIARSDEAFTVERDSNFLKLHQPMFMRREGDKYVYFIGETNDLSAARDFLKTTALPIFPKARLVEFKNGEKTYLK